MSHSPATTLRRRLLREVRRWLLADRPADPQDPPFRTDGGDGHEREETDDHLRDVPDGAGCTEIWEHLSEREASEARADD